MNRERVHANEVPKITGPDEKFSVYDEFGHVYHMNKNPYDIFLKKDGNDYEVHVVYSAKESKLAGQRKREDPF